MNLNYLKYLVNKAKSYINKPNESLVKIYINRNHLLHNLNQFKGINQENRVIPVLKSNAYGHGLVEVAKILENEVQEIIVDSYFEALKIRKAGIKTKIIIIGYVRPDCINQSRLKNISYVITSIETLNNIKSKTNIHLKIDTGMHRQGILPDEIDPAFKIIKDKNKILNLEGICSHLADADSDDANFTEKQIDLWNTVANKSISYFGNIKYLHLSNSSGHKYIKKINSNTTRLGIGLYGLINIDGMNLKPVLEMETIITSIKKINKGDYVGYNNTFVADKDMLIATLPAGYYEGVDRNLSNKGFVKINNSNYPFVGRISMNISTIDISNIKNAKIGDSVQLISIERNDPNSIESIANITSKISYEIAVKIPANIKRTVV